MVYANRFHYNPNGTFLSSTIGRLHRTVNAKVGGSNPPSGAKGAFKSEKLAEILGILGVKMAGNRILVLRESPFVIIKERRTP